MTERKNPAIWLRRTIEQNTSARPVHIRCDEHGQWTARYGKTSELSEPIDLTNCVGCYLDGIGTAELAVRKALARGGWPLVLRPIA